MPQLSAPTKLPPRHPTLPLGSPISSDPGPHGAPTPQSAAVVLLRPTIAATLDRRLDQRELELAWGCQVLLDDVLTDHGFQVVVDRRPVVQSWAQSDLVAYAVAEAQRVAPHARLAVLTRFDRSAPHGARAEGIVIDLVDRRIVTRGRAEPNAPQLMAWVAHVPDHVAFALGEPTPKISWRELLGVRDSRRALDQIRLAGALARVARLGSPSAD